MLSKGETLASLSSEVSGRIPARVNSTHHPHNPHPCAQAHTLMSLLGDRTSTRAGPGLRPGLAAQ